MTITRHQARGKSRYATKREAIRYAIASSKRSELPLRVYRCPTCKGFHLTKRAEWTEVARRLADRT